MPDDLNAKFDALKALCAAATPPPWHTASIFVRGESDEDIARVTDEWDYSGEPRDWEPDGEFIAAARNALPALIEFASLMVSAAPTEHSDTCPKKHGYEHMKCRCDKAWMDELIAKVAAALEGVK